MPDQPLSRFRCRPLSLRCSRLTHTSQQCPLSKDNAHQIEHRLKHYGHTSCYNPKGLRSALLSHRGWSCCWAEWKIPGAFLAQGWRLFVHIGQWTDFQCAASAGKLLYSEGLSKRRSLAKSYTHTVRQCNQNNKIQWVSLTGLLLSWCFTNRVSSISASLSSCRSSRFLDTNFSTAMVQWERTGGNQWQHRSETSRGSLN